MEIHVPPHQLTNALVASRYVSGVELLYACYFEFLLNSAYIRVFCHAYTIIFIFSFKRLMARHSLKYLKNVEGKICGCITVRNLNIHSWKYLPIYRFVFVGYYQNLCIYRTFYITTSLSLSSTISGGSTTLFLQSKS